MIGKIFLLTMVWLIATNAMGQVILNHEQIPDTGSQYYYSFVSDTTQLNHFNFVKAGDNCVWDFRELERNYMDTFYILDPGRAPNYDQFTTARYVQAVNNSTAFSYFEADSSGIYYLGIFDSWDNTLFTAKRPILEKPFPFQKGASSEDSSVEVSPPFAFLNDSMEWDSMYYMWSIKKSTKVIATGTLLLPTDTFPALLAKESTASHFFTMVKTFKKGIWEIFKEEDHGVSWIYQWYAPFSTWFVARVFGEGDTSGTALISYYMGHYSPKGVGLNNIYGQSGLSIYPNPASQKIYLTHKSMGKCSYNITNLLGQKVLESTDISSGTQDQMQVDIQTLMQGIYTITVIGGEGQAFSARFVKQE